MKQTVNLTTVSPQNGKETCFSSFNTAGKFYIKELDWKAKTMCFLVRVASTVWLIGYPYTVYVHHKKCA